jgi:hypothetical protein
MENKHKSTFAWSVWFISSEAFWYTKLKVKCVCSSNFIDFCKRVIVSWICDYKLVMLQPAAVPGTDCVCYWNVKKKKKKSCSISRHNPQFPEKYYSPNLEIPQWNLNFSCVVMCFYVMSRVKSAIFMTGNIIWFDIKKPDDIRWHVSSLFQLYYSYLVQCRCIL